MENNELNSAGADGRPKPKPLKPLVKTNYSHDSEYHTVYESPPPVARSTKRWRPCFSI